MAEYLAQFKADDKTSSIRRKICDAKYQDKSFEKENNIRTLKRVASTFSHNFVMDVLEEGVVAAAKATEKLGYDSAGKKKSFKVEDIRPHFYV